MALKNSYFIPKSTDSGEIISLDPYEVQQFCNFVIFTPADLPKDLTLVQQNLRTEDHSGIRATYRLVFEGMERRLIVKQFLYDWAPPAYDYPCLWRNNKIVNAQDVLPPKGLFIGNNVLWIGENYRNQNAATIEIERTRIEFTLEKGDFTVDELSEFCRQFKPIDEDIRHKILNTPFSNLSYCSRHLDKVSRVPTGYWKHQRNEMMFCFSIDKHEEQDVLKLFSIKKYTRILNNMNYLLDSIFVFGDKKEEFAEVEFIFEHVESKSSIRILAALPNSKNPIEFPPVISDQLCISKRFDTTTRKNPIYYACSSTFDYGQHELVFKHDNINYIMLIKPAPWTSQDWLMQLIEKLQ